MPGAATLRIHEGNTDADVNRQLFRVPAGLVRILNRDLLAAGIPKRDERGRTIDVHALRHSVGTLLSKGGVSPRTAQAAMRHSKIDMTMNVYTDPKLLDVHGALMYCSFNGICIAAIKLLNDGLVKKVGVYDADAHAGNGTEDIIRTLGLEEKILHWSFGYQYNHRTFRQDQFMDDLNRTLRNMKSEGVELVIAQCAADSHIHDDLGGFQTTEDLRDRGFRTTAAN